MQYRLLGRAGVRVSELCLGTMTFGEEWGWGSTREESRKVFDAYCEAGGNFLDTANKYTEGTSEKVVGEFIRSDREHFVVATKYSLTMNPQDLNASGNHRKNMMQSVEASLKRLGTDYIDLYWLHAWDFTTRIDEVMRAFDDLVRQGKILYAGISDAPAWIVSAANTMADLKSWSAFVGLQIEYNLIERTPERELVPMAEAFDLAIAAWSPLASGMLTGKYKTLEDVGHRDRRLSEGSHRLSERNFEIARAVETVAERTGHSCAQIAIAWLLQCPGLVIPIIGARRLEQLENNLGALEVALSPDDVAFLDEASSISLGFPHEFLERETTQDIVFGEKRGLLHPHR